MTSWVAYPQVGDLGQLKSGSQLDFIENVQVAGIPPAILNSGDTFYVEWPNNNRSDGKVISNNNGIFRIEIDGDIFDIRHPVNSDYIHKTRSQMRIDHWFVV